MEDIEVGAEVVSLKCCIFLTSIEILAKACKAPRDLPTACNW